jgi:hypothetical protein
VEYGRLIILAYLPREMLPEDFWELGFDEFFHLLGAAQAVREMRIEDIEVGVNRGYVEAHPDT